MIGQRPFTAAELAVRLGRSVDWVYRHQRALEAAGMPRPILPTGKRSWDRAGMEAWLTRHDQRRPQAAANDALPPPTPHSDGEWSAFLHRHYAGGA